MQLFIDNCSRVIVRHICIFETVSLTIVSRAAGGSFFFSSYSIRGVKSLPSQFQESCVFLVLFCHPVVTGENREKSPKILRLERSISPHAASKMPWLHLRRFFAISLEGKKKHKPLSALSSSHASAFPSLYVFVSGVTADTSLMT